MASTPSVCILWFRQDLRLQDNPALQHAIEAGMAILPVYILDDPGEASWPMGGASKWWLHHALADLDKSLQAVGSKLILRQGDSGAVLNELIRESNASAVFWNRRYEPAIIERDKGIKAELKEQDITVKSFNASLLFEPHEVQNKSGKPFQVFTPFWKHCRTRPIPEPIKVNVKNIASPKNWPKSSKLAALSLLPTITWDTEFLFQLGANCGCCS